MTDPVPTEARAHKHVRSDESWNGTDAARATDDAAARDSLTSDVRRGLARAQKALPPKYFYDRAGSELFEEITRLPEYYLTRAERRLLLRWSRSSRSAIGRAPSSSLAREAAKRRASFCARCANTEAPTPTCRWT